MVYCLNMDPDGSSNTNSKPNSKNPLKIEWTLFWEGLLGDGRSDSASEKLLEVDPKDPQEIIRALPREKIPQLKRELSAQRNELHKRIEKLHKELELNTNKLESLQLVGGESEETIERINELTDLGQELSFQLEKLDQKLKWVRELEKEDASERNLA